ALLAIVIASVLIILAEPVGEWVQSTTRSSRSTGPTVATLSDIDGSVRLVEAGNLRAIKLKASTQLPALQRVLVDKKSSARLELANGFRLNIQGPAEFTIEEWNPGDNKSPLYLQWL